jgi:hypothetical protein
MWIDDTVEGELPITHNIRSIDIDDRVNSRVLCQQKCYNLLAFFEKPSTTMWSSSELLTKIDVATMCQYLGGFQRSVEQVAQSMTRVSVENYPEPTMASKKEKQSNHIRTLIRHQR